jgi:cytochrome c553
MKKLLFVLLVVVFAASMAAAQLNSNYASSVDVQGAHNNHGRGCTGCHVPHSGPAGNGEVDGAGFQGNLALWGQNPGTLAGTTINFGDAGGWAETLPTSDAATTPDLGGLLLCLTCHDGNLAKGAMMTGKVDWAGEGLNWQALGYASDNVPTWLGNDGSGTNNYQNDHPAGLNAVYTCAATWCTLDASAKFTPAGLGVNFNNNYGFTARLSAYNNTGVVMCTTCHNQHVMTVYNGTIAGTKGYYQTQFGIRGYYNPANQGNSVSQFCRQCHNSHANEWNNALTIPTT